MIAAAGRMAFLSQVEEEKMHVIVATLRIKPEFRERFMVAMIDDARGSVENERGCFQFSVTQDKTDPNRIVLFEVYRDEAAFDTHKQAPHFVRWQESVKDWFAAPTEVIQGGNAFPADSTWKK